MANRKEIKNDPCGLTNYRDEDHRDPRYESGNPPKTTFMEMRGIEKKGNFTELQVQSFGDSRVEVGNGKDIMDGKGSTIKTFEGGYKNNSEIEKE